MNRLAKFAAAWVFGCSLTLGAFNATAQEAKPEPPPAPPKQNQDDELEARIDKMLNAYDLSPQPLPEVPDNPPPHEGAMIDMPTYRVEPPDLVLVEVLEALPGRPISGERLVGPDGTMVLGFYGKLHVRGLTIEQVKVKLIKHMRRFLTDDILGMYEVDPGTGGIHNMIDAKDSDRVFVDVTAYNSKNYYVLGDVAQPGKLPSTGNETVLDALQYAGGLHHTADPRKVDLVRPGRGDKPGKVYPVDLEAIQERGETATNYQLFPGDRIIVGRNEVVEKTIQIDRTSTAIQDVINSIRQEALMVRAVKEAAPDQPEVLLENLVEFWIHELNRPEGAVFDEKTLREVLLRRLNVKPEAPKEK